MRPWAGRRSDQIVAAGFGVESGRSIARNLVAKSRLGPNEASVAPSSGVIPAPDAVPRACHHRSPVVRDSETITSPRPSLQAEAQPAVAPVSRRSRKAAQQLENFRSPRKSGSRPSPEDE